MKRPLLALLCLFALTAVRGAGLNPDQIPAGARWVAHVDVDALRETTGGKRLLALVNQGMPANQINAVKALTGVDLRTDLHGITACGKSDKPSEAALVVHGTFDAERLITILKANGTYKSDTLVGNQMVHSWLEEKKPGQPRQYAAFVGDRVVISGGAEALKAVVGGLRGEGVIADGEALSLDAFKGAVFAAAANLEGLAERDPKAAMLKKARSAMVSLGEAEGNLVGMLQVLTEDDASAAQLGAMANGMMAFAQINQDADPNLKRLVQGLTPILDGRKVGMRLKLPVGELLDKVEQELKRKTAKTST